MKPQPLSPEDFSAGVDAAAKDHAINDDFELVDFGRLGVPAAQATALLACAHASAIRRLLRKCDPGKARDELLAGLRQLMHPDTPDICAPGDGSAAASPQPSPAAARVFTKGDRVRSSKLLAERHPKVIECNGGKPMTGCVVKDSDEHSVVVQWDDRVMPVALALELVEPEQVQ